MQIADADNHTDGKNRFEIGEKVHTDEGRFARLETLSP